MRHVPLVALLAFGCASGTAIRDTLPPDLGKRVVAEHGMVTSANPLASEAGEAMLQAGGNAVDAAVATAFAIGVVEPQMSGLGAGGGMLIWLQAEGRVEYEDFYSAQPAASFRGHTSERTDDSDLRIVAIPGEVAGLLAAHERFGRLPRAQVMEPAIRLAEQGFPINQILAQMIAGDSVKLNRFPESAAMFWPNGHALGPGDVLRNPELAASLRTVAERGRAGFYEGEIARRVVALLNAHDHPATLKDFAAYEPRWRRPLCAEYRDLTLLSAPPPQSGSQILHTLKLLEPFDLPSLGLPTKSAEAFDVMTSALRAGIADNRANDDPAWVDVPAAGIVSDAFARERGALVGNGKPAERIDEGDAAAWDSTPPEASCARFDPYGPAAAALKATGSIHDGTEHGGETTHISVVDGEGNAVALTQTNSSLFGSGARVAGFFLNDSGYLFDADELAGALPAQWRIRRSTIAPTVVLEDGHVTMVVGAPGGGRIPTAMVQTMVYTLDYRMDPLAALRMPRIFPTPNRPSVQIENGFEATVLRDARAMGYEPAALSFGYARLYMIVRRDGRWIGVADPRHDGEARGNDL